MGARQPEQCGCACGSEHCTGQPVCSAACSAPPSHAARLHALAALAGVAACQTSHHYKLTSTLIATSTAFLGLQQGGQAGGAAAGALPRLDHLCRGEGSAMHPLGTISGGQPLSGSRCLCGCSPAALDACTASPCMPQCVQLEYLFCDCTRMTPGLERGGMRRLAVHPSMCSVLTPLPVCCRCCHRR